jgi:phage terminase large subunit GpA-like protein
MASATIPLDSIAAIRSVSADVCETVFQPPPKQTVSEWADANRMLPQTSAEPGRWRTARVPYLREIMDTLGDDAVREVVFVKSAQVGGTSCGENFIGYLIDQAPCGVLMLWPTEKKLRSWSRKQLKPLLQETQCLAEKVPESRRRESGNTIAAKEYPGGFLQLLTAKSTSDLRSTSARVGVIEEEDEVDAEIKDQGDPIEQFDARFRTFWNSKQYKVSTPTLEGFSRIWDEWERSDQRHFFVPCPHCRHVQRLRWRDGRDDQDEAGAYRLLWDEDDAGEVVPGSAKYVCEGCAATIDEHHKMGMLTAGEWRATHPGRYVVGFHINTLYSPLCSWDDIARAFKKAKKSPTTMQTFVNLWLGLPYREPGQQIDAHFLESRAEDYGPPEIDVPSGVAVLTAGVDVQGDRLVVAVWGWGEHDGWQISYDELNGDPGGDDVWKDLDRLLLAPWKHASGATLPLLAACVDANYQTDQVHKFCTPRVGRNIVAIIGRDGRGRKLIEPPKPDRWKRASRERHPAYVVGTDTAKDTIASRLKLHVTPEGAYPAGFLHFRDTLDSAFYEQLTAERLTTVYKSGRPHRIWKPIEGRRNEALDCTVYALAAFRFLTMGRAPKVNVAKLAEIAKSFADWKPPTEEEKVSRADAPPSVRRRGGGWMDGYR